MTDIGSNVIEHSKADLAEKYCPICKGLNECALGTFGWVPKLDEEATEIYNYETYAYSFCRYKEKQLATEQIKNQISEKFTKRNFSTFSINKDNKEAFDKCFNYAQGFHRGTKDGIMLVGPYGTGKTHLAAAILQVVLDRGISGAMVVVPDLLEEIRQTFGNEKDKRLIQKVREKRFLILDDIGSEKTTDWVQEQLFTLINYRYENELPTMITTNCEVGELIKKLGERTVDRLKEMCDGARLKGKSYRNTIRQNKGRANNA